MEKLQPRWSWRKPNLIQVAKYYSPGSIRSVMALFEEPEFGESGGTGCIRSAATLSGDIYGTNTNGIIGDTLILQVTGQQQRMSILWSASGCGGAWHWRER